ALDLPAAGTDVVERPVGGAEQTRGDLVVGAAVGELRHEDERDRDGLQVRELPPRPESVGQALLRSDDVSPLQRVRGEMDEREGSILRVADTTGDVGRRLRV